MAEDIHIAGCRLVVLGGSAGSLEALLQIIPNLRQGLPFAILIVMHRKNGNDEALVRLLSSRTAIPVKEAEEKELIAPGIIYIAPSDHHLLIEKDHTFSLDVSEKVNFSRPSIDVTFEVAAEVFGAATVCALLSGANADGAQGLIAVNADGGVCIAQAPATAEVPYMPQQAINNGSVSLVLSP